MTPDYYDIARFWSKVVVEGVDDCWLFSGHKKWFGHGELKFLGRKESAHRVAYRLAVGEVPPGGILRHTCDNPACCNPKHLVPGTHADNVADRVRRNRSATGERNGRSKLTEEQVLQIYNSVEPASVLSRRYAVDRKVISDIRHGRTWKSVTSHKNSHSENRPDFQVIDSMVGVARFELATPCTPCKN